jgi:hypothetical protein
MKDSDSNNTQTIRALPFVRAHVIDPHEAELPMHHRLSWHTSVGNPLGYKVGTKIDGLIVDEVHTNYTNEDYTRWSVEEETFNKSLENA